MVEQTNLQKKSFYGYLILLSFLAVIMLLVASQKTLDAAPESLQAPMIPDNPLEDAPVCRYGVSSWNENDNPYIDMLGVGWVLDFQVNLSRPIPTGIEYTPVVRFKQERDPVTNERLPSYIVTTQPFTDEPGGLGPIIAANPGRLWLIGNEVDRIIWQDDLEPHIYAIAYHDAYTFIKERDPLARIAISGLVEVTPGRLQYLDLVWDAYKETYGVTMPVDVWNMHIYILPERREYRPGDNPHAEYYNSRAAVAIGTDPNLAIWESDGTTNQCYREDVYCYAEHDDINIFADQVLAMRQWMKSKGQQNKPLILSEFSLLYPYIPEGGSCYLQDEYGNCFTPQRVINFMNKTLDYLETATSTNLGYPADNYRLVQQWLWYTMYDSFTEGTVNNMVTADSEGNRTGLSLNGVNYQNRIATNGRFVNHIITKTSNPVAYTTSPTSSVSVSLTTTILNNGNTTATEPMVVSFYADEELTQVIGTAVLTEPLYGCAMQQTAVSVTWPDLTSGTFPYWVTISNELETGLVLINPQSVYLPFASR